MVERGTNAKLSWDRPVAKLISGEKVMLMMIGLSIMDPVQKARCERKQMLVRTKLVYLYYFVGYLWCPCDLKIWYGTMAMNSVST
jgi:hypothetical protein